MDFDDLESLSKYIIESVMDTMEEDVSQVVKEVESQVLNIGWYQNYTPTSYRRRGNNGGFMDVENMMHKITNNGFSIELEVTNETPTSRQRPYELSEAIYYGGDYFEAPYGASLRDEKRYPYLKGFHYTDETIEKLEDTQLHVKALIKGLKQRGIPVDL